MPLKFLLVDFSTKNPSRIINTARKKQNQYLTGFCRYFPTNNLQLGTKYTILGGHLFSRRLWIISALVPKMSWELLHEVMETNKKFICLLILLSPISLYALLWFELQSYSALRSKVRTGQGYPCSARCGPKEL
jgi:hypothetical protein